MEKYSHIQFKELTESGIEIWVWNLIEKSELHREVLENGMLRWWIKTEDGLTLLRPEFNEFHENCRQLYLRDFLVWKPLT